MHNVVRLLVGAPGIQPSHVVAGLIVFAIMAGQQWYIIVALALATWAANTAVRKAVGEFVPIFRADEAT